MSGKSLSELFKAFPHARLASESEGPFLARMIQSQFMELKGTSVGFDRGEDFFSLFRSYTKQYWVFLILNEDRSIAGFASLTRFRGKVRGEEKWIGYFGDLRLDAKADHCARKQWRAAYPAIVRHVEDPESDEHCDHMVTAVFQENIRALHIFKARLKELKYHELKPYWNLSVFSAALLCAPAQRRRVGEFEVREAEQSLLESLERPSLSLSPLPVGPEFHPVIAHRASGNAAAGALLWDARSARTLRVKNLPTGLRIVFRWMSLVSGIKYEEDASWLIRFLGCLSYAPGASSDEKLNSISALIRRAFRVKSRDFHLLNITLTDEKLCRDLQRRFPLSKVTAGWLFEVTSADRKATLAGENLVFEGSFL